MNFRKYVRLFIVLFLPLFGLGYVLYSIHSPYTKYQYILCGGDSCRFMGSEQGKLYNSVKKQYQNWFDVSVASTDKYLVNFIQASGRILNSVEIVDAVPHAIIYGPEVKKYMKTFIGKNASVFLGMNPGDKSIILDNYFILNCNELRFFDDVSTFSARCYGNGWDGLIKFISSGQDKERLTDLRQSIMEKINQRESDYLTYRIVTYPLFIYIFLVLSAFAWVSSKAIKFVRNG